MARSSVLRQVGRLQAQLQRPGELQEARDQRVGAVHFDADEAGHLARHFVLRADAAVQHFRRGLDGAQRIAQLVRQAGRELPQRGQPVGAAHRFFRLAGSGVGFGQLLGGAAVLRGLHAQVLGQRCWPGCPTMARKTSAQTSIGDLGHSTMHWSSRGTAGKTGRRRRPAAVNTSVPSHAERGGGRDHRQQQHQPVAAVDAARVADQQVAQHQLQQRSSRPARACESSAGILGSSTCTTASADQRHHLGGVAGSGWWRPARRTAAARRDPAAGSSRIQPGT